MYRDLLSRLESRPAKADRAENCTLRKLIESIRPAIAKLHTEKGCSWKDIVGILAEENIAIAESTLRNYYYGIGMPVKTEAVSVPSPVGVGSDASSEDQAKEVKEDQGGGQIQFMKFTNVGGKPVNQDRWKNWKKK
jgi:hypothetical protein